MATGSPGRLFPRRFPSSTAPRPTCTPRGEGAVRTYWVECLLVTETSFSATTAPGTLALSGEIDAADHRSLNDVIEKASESFSQDLSIDLSDVTFLPSIIVGVLARATVMAEKNGSRLRLLAVEGTVPQRVLTVCKIGFETVGA